MSNFWRTKVPIVAPLSRKQIEEDARVFLKKFSSALKYPSSVDVEKIYEIILPKIIDGLNTGYVDLSKIGPNVMGYTDASKKVSYVDIKLYELSIERPRSVEARRFRATVAHEIGHCFYHIHQLETFKSFSGNEDGVFLRAYRSEIPAYRDPEWQAWEYASALLMPSQHVFTLLSQGKDIYELAEIFDVNPAFVKARIKKLKKIKI